MLARNPGLQLASDGGLGEIGTVFIRGLEWRHTLLLVDGVRVSSATVGSPSWTTCRSKASSASRSCAARCPRCTAAMRSAAWFRSSRAAARGLPARRQAHRGSSDTASWPVAWPSAAARSTPRCSCSTPKTAAFRDQPAAPFGSLHPDDDGFVQNAGSLRLGGRPRAAGASTRSRSKPGKRDTTTAPARLAREADNRMLSLQAAAARRGTASELSAGQSIDSSTR